MTELASAIIWAILFIVSANVAFRYYFASRGFRLSRFEQWLQHFRYQAGSYDGERMFAAALVVVVVLAWIAG